MTIIEEPKDDLSDGYCMACSDYRIAGRLCDLCSCCIEHHSTKCSTRAKRRPKEHVERDKVATKVMAATWNRIGQGCS